MKFTKRQKDQMTVKELDEVEVVHYNGKILIPLELKEEVLNWYHTMLAHP